MPYVITSTNATLLLLSIAHACMTQLYLRSAPIHNSVKAIFRTAILTFAKVKLTAADELATVASLMALAIGVGPQKYVWYRLKSAKSTPKS